MNRRFVIMAGNLGQGFGIEFAEKYRDSLNDAFRCEVADGNMQPIKVVVDEGSGKVPRGGWETDEDEDVIRSVADEIYNRLVYAENYEDPCCEQEWHMEDFCESSDDEGCDPREIDDDDAEGFDDYWSEVDWRIEE